jgi:hypothetical protein
VYKTASSKEGAAMPKFSEHFSLGLTQHELDFVDVSNEYDTPVYVDPYAIEIHDDVWSAHASEYIRTFFLEVLNTLRRGDLSRAEALMSHFTEPQETFLGVSRGSPQGRGVGRMQSRQLMRAIRGSEAFRTGLLSDLSDMALYVEGIDRDKISDLTTNVIRQMLVEYTVQQCELLGVPVAQYASPPMWDNDQKRWKSRYVNLPYIDKSPIMLVPKYVVRRKLSLDSQEFYNKQITDFLVAEQLRADTSLVQVIKGKRVVYKGAVREKYPKSKPMIAGLVKKHPELLDLYKDIARKQRPAVNFGEDGPSMTAVCSSLSSQYAKIPAGAKHADSYHRLIMGSLTTLFYPDLIQPHKEWEIHGGRKRIDIVFTNSADGGFFAQRRSDKQMNANMVIVECKNYSNDIANAEFDQLLGRFDDNRGKFGLITYRRSGNPDLILQRCRDAAARSQGYILALSDDDIVGMLNAKASLNDDRVSQELYAKYREIIA